MTTSTPGPETSAQHHGAPGPDSGGPAAPQFVPMQNGSPQPVVGDEPDEQRIAARIGGELAGFVAYQRIGHTLALLHTEVDSAFEGRGIGGQLARASLDHARSHGLAVLPYCPFIRAYLKRHPDDLDLVPASRRAEFELPEAAE